MRACVKVIFLRKYFLEILVGSGEVGPERKEDKGEYNIL